VYLLRDKSKGILVLNQTADHIRVYPSTTRRRENSLHARDGQPLPASVKQQHEALFQQFESYLEQLQDNASTSQQLTVAQARDAFVQQQSLSAEQQHGLDFQINTRIEQVGHLLAALRCSCGRGGTHVSLRDT
jgi:hypothetical protein